MNFTLTLCLTKNTLWNINSLVKIPPPNEIYSYILLKIVSLQNSHYISTWPKHPNELHTFVCHRRMNTSRKRNVRLPLAIRLQPKEFGASPLLGSSASPQWKIETPTGQSWAVIIFSLWARNTQSPTNQLCEWISHYLLI